MISMQFRLVAKIDSTNLEISAPLICQSKWKINKFSFRFVGEYQEMYATIRGLYAIGEHHWNVQHKRIVQRAAPK